MARLKKSGNIGYYGEILPEIVTRSFTVDSGEIVYGQVQNVVHGYHTTVHDKCYPPKEFGDEDSDDEDDGPIVKHTLNFKCAARTGTWNVCKIIMTEMGDNAVTGYIFHHSDIDPQEVVDNVKKMGYDNQFDNPNIVYINRYEWNGEENLKLPKDIPGYGNGLELDGNMSIRRIMFFDKDHILQNGHGIHIETPEGEFPVGYLVFSGEKHSTFKESDELVAFVYDKNMIIDRCVPEQDDEEYKDFKAVQMEDGEQPGYFLY
ncbi:hypothetical protein GQ42DRAFT_16222 [Ramicandelaber brevisporus]|nr:hypothetical protein GQ42DRAFT_16222 [Ramicandelaber brevisporus]